jgi:hypothetical protein
VVLLAVGVAAGCALNFHASAMLLGLGAIAGLCGIALLGLAALRSRPGSRGHGHGPEQGP